jgi:hypothetical protein
MLFGETVAVYCENHTEHKDTVRTSQETHYISVTEPKRLMLFGETVVVYYENHTEHTDTVRTSQETYYVSATKPNRLMLFGETVAVHCENHTEHTDTVRTSQETHYVSATVTNRLMLFGETVAVYYENHAEHANTLCGQNIEIWCVTADETYWALKDYYTYRSGNCKSYLRHWQHLLYGSAVYFTKWMKQVACEWKESRHTYGGGKLRMDQPAPSFAMYAEQQITRDAI